MIPLRTISRACKIACRNDFLPLKLELTHVRHVTSNTNVYSKYIYYFHLLTLIYNSVVARKNDPTKAFLDNEVQNLLKTLTRKDLSKVYKRRKLGQKHLEQPVYKFMTDSELQQALAETNAKADEILQMPPVLPVRDPRDRVISRDPALQGLETSRLVFTDITFGVPDSKRVIIVRETDGTLRDAEWELRDRMNQLYFPRAGRELTPPKMFSDEFFKDVLERKEYEFILDRACTQFEPDDELYQKACSAVYEAINENCDFEKLRSTRHFGPFVFYLAWHKNIDNLLLDLIETSNIEEAGKLVALYGKLHKIEFEGHDPGSVIVRYIEGHSAKKAPLELALQAYREVEQKKRELESGIRAVHGGS